MFVGEDELGRPKQVSRTVRRTKRAAKQVAAELTVWAPPPSQGHTVADALDAWLETNTPTWAESTVRDQTSRVSLVKADKIAGVVVDRLSVADVDRWHARLRERGVDPQLAPRAEGGDVAGGALGMGEHERCRHRHARPAQVGAARGPVG